MREYWQEDPAENSDLLRSGLRHQAVQQIPGVEIDGDESLAMAGCCSMETQSKMTTTAIMHALPVNSPFASERANLAIRLIHFSKARLLSLSHETQAALILMQM